MVSDEEEKFCNILLQICEALAEPDPEVTWYKDQIPIFNGGPYVVEKPSNGRSILTIDQLTKADSGLYTCMARNTVGAMARNFTLVSI